jgi:predicted O-methyltransferase YrrM
MMADPYSFQDVLIEWLKKIKPSMILEWGPGVSTAIMLKVCPKAHILSLEDKKHWHKLYTVKFSRFHNVHIKYAVGREYEVYPLQSQQKFDFVFVDGLCDSRAECLKTAYNVVAEDGVVMLHDCERTKYHDGIKLFKELERRDETLVMKK